MSVTRKSGRYEYLKVVQNERVDGRVRQRVMATLGRVDRPFNIRSQTRGDGGQALQAVGVALGPAVRVAPGKPVGA